MKLQVGQVIAIPVLTRHIKTSSGKCETGNLSVSSNCVMADALRDRFAGTTYVCVGNESSDVDLDDGWYVALRNGDAMNDVIDAFDEAMDQVRAGSLTHKQALKQVRESTPRVVHAEVIEFSPSL